jgi:putative PIN family toxin of toxin-antitoxin system
MKVVIDTNVILVSISTKSPFHWIIQNWIENKFTLCLSTEILLEYEEIIQRHMGSLVSEPFIESLLQNPAIQMFNVYFRWNLLSDGDDNKFVDCALASGADYLVTNDRGFSELKGLKFPVVKIIDIQGFKSLF